MKNKQLHKEKAYVICILLSLFFFNTQAQPLWRKGGNNITGGPPILGTDATWNSPLLFVTFGTQQMIIKNGTGFVGIGTGFSTPTQLLDVNGGNINVNTNTDSYMIGTKSVLWNKGANTNIFVGVGAGAAHPFSASNFNTFVGAGANGSGNGGMENTVVGAQAGFNNVNSKNVYIGYKAGFPCVGTANTFVGHSAGSNNAPTADENVFVGWQTGMNNKGVHNTFVGNNAGANNGGSDCSFFGIGSGAFNGSFQGNSYFGAGSGNTGAGDNNVFMGVGSGQLGVGSNNVAVGYGSALAQTAGQGNTYVGYQSAPVLTNGTANTFVGENTGIGMPSGAANTFIGANASSWPVGTALNNAAAIGSNALVTANNKMILGDNSINVGIGLSGNPTPPSNKLEINDNGIGSPTAANPNTCPPSFGSSGLRFRQMTSVTPPVGNPGQGVLSVDCNGDVIYVGIPAPPPGCCVGNQCGAPLNPLPLPGWNVPLNNTTYNFTSLASSLGSQVNIGFPSCTTFVARLNTETDIHRFAGAFINNNGFAAGFQCVGVGGAAVSTNTNAVGVRGQANSAPAANAAIGVDGGANDPTSTAGTHIGVQGWASNGVNESRGGIFQVIPGVSPSGTNIGVSGFVDVTNNVNATNVGGVFSSRTGGNKTFGAIGGIATSALINPENGVSLLPNGIQIGVYGYQPVPSFAIPGLSWAGYFDGDVKIVGSQAASPGTSTPPGPYALNVVGNALTTAGAWYLSDKRYKSNIKQLENVPEKIKKLSGYNYVYKTEEFKEKHFNSGNQIGLIAQEIKEVFPELVKEDKDGYLAVNYQGMIPVLLEAIKEQQKQIENQTSANGDIQKQLDDQKKINDALQSKMDKLEQMINSCCSAGSNARTINGQNVDLSDKNVIILNQNVPNPFAESTVITYNIPVDFKKAQINFSTTDGKIIRSVDITSKGEGRLNVFANDLTNGLYTYTLIVDGKVIDTKKMVKD